MAPGLKEGVRVVALPGLCIVCGKRKKFLLTDGRQALSEVRLFRLQDEEKLENGL